MRALPLILPVVTVLGLLACNAPSVPNRAEAAPANAVRDAAATAQADAGTGNGLWGVAEAEDEASHRGLDFIAFNRSGRTITALSLRPDEGPLAEGAAENAWSANILAQRELPDSQRAAAHYEADIELCRWQLRATFADRQSRDYPAVNLCDTIRVDLR